MKYLILFFIIIIQILLLLLFYKWGYKIGIKSIKETPKIIEVKKDCCEGDLYIEYPKKKGDCRDLVADMRVYHR